MLLPATFRLTILPERFRAPPCARRLSRAALAGTFALLAFLSSGTANADPVALSIGVPDGARYGYRFQGTNENREEAAFTFDGGSGPIDLSARGFDIDSGNEIRVLVNGTRVGYLARTPNNDFATSALTVPVSAQTSGENTLRFVQKRPGFVWGVTDILLSADSNGGQGPDERTPRLTLSAQDGTRYGYRFEGLRTHREEATFLFEGEGAPLRLSVRAFDIDSANEVRVRVNEATLGYLDVTPNNGFGVSVLDIPASAQTSGDNTLSFTQKRPGYVWGITDLLLEPGTDTPPDPDPDPDPPAANPPVADAGANLTTTLGTPVTLDGSASSDPDDDIVAYRWADADGETLSDEVTATLTPATLGDEIYTLTVTDAGGRTDSDSVRVRTSGSTAPGPDKPGYELVFADEFDGPVLDPDKWYTALLWGPYYPINNEQQLYVDTLGMHAGFGHSPFEMTGETLKITATPTSPDLQPPPRPPEGDPAYRRKHSTYRYNGPTRDPDTGATDPGYRPADVDYLSGIITSYDAFKMTHGYVEARAKLPAGRGLWPAFWLLPTHYVHEVPEIDVMEFLGQDVDRLYHTFHFFDVPAGWKLISTPSFPVYATDWTQDFHTFGLRWSPRKITWYVDGVETHSITDQDVHGPSGRNYEIPAQAMYLIANLAVGGNWPGPADDTTPFPATYELDYIRAYKKRTAEPIDLARDYQIMFREEFDGESLDPTKWNSHFLWGPYLPINREEQYYIDALHSDAGLGYSPFRLENGILSITARAADDPEGVPPPTALPGPNAPVWSDHPTFRQNENYVPQRFTSGMLTSYDSFKFANGYAAIRARVPRGDGLWPAFWLLNAHYISQQPEIDVFEFRGRRPDQAVHNYHRYRTGGVLDSDEYVTTRGTAAQGYADGFHTYAARWRPGRIDFYVDGVREHTYRGADVGYQLMYVIVNLAVGGGFDPGATPDPAIFPQSLDIDWIRVYQERD